MLKLHAIGGYGEFGRNMTALQFNGQIIVLDCGIKLQRSNYFETNKIIPDFTYLKDLESTVIGLIISHAHLDHCGAITEFTKLYNVPLYCSKYTYHLLKKLGLHHKPEELEFNKEIELGNFKISAMETQHSIPDSLIIKIKVDEKIIVYASDFKLDYTPVIGNATNLKTIAEFCEKPTVLIIDTTRAIEKNRTKSETYVTGMLEDLFGYYTNYSRNIFITSFASNIARIKTISNLAKKYKYELIVIGTAFDAYLYAAKMCKFLSGLKLIKDAHKFFNNHNLQSEKKYLFLVTGSQGEKGSFLYKLVRNKFKYNNLQKDLVIFSSSCIPEHYTILQRENLILKLKELKVKIIDNVHTSGHASLEDHINFMQYVEPKIIIPTHSDFSTCGFYVAQAKTKDFMLSKTILVLQNKQIIDII